MNTSYPLDNSGIVHLAVKNRRTTNTFRLSFYLHENINAVLLQQAADAICPRFPTMAAGIRPGFSHYRVVPVSRILVQKDPGLLTGMSWKELHHCATRIFYHGRELAVEMFHSLADGYGAWHFMRTLTAEYLRLACGLDPDSCPGLLSVESPIQPGEVEDSFLANAWGQKGKMTRTPSYLIRPTGSYTRKVRATILDLPVEPLLATAREHGVSLTTLLTTVMAASVQELQARQTGGREDVQIMVPINLRKLFPSESLRNFSLYALPTIKSGEEALPIKALLPSIQTQLAEGFRKETLQTMITTNVTTERHPLLRPMPLFLKKLGIRVGYRFVGARNSSITFSNLGQLFIPEPMQPYIAGVDVFLTPRIYGPYNCGAVSHNGHLHIIVTRSCEKPGLEPILTERLAQLGHRAVISEKC